MAESSQHDGNRGGVSLPSRRESILEWRFPIGSSKPHVAETCLVACAVGPVTNQKGRLGLHRLMAGICRRLGLLWYTRKLVFLKLDLDRVSDDPDCLNNMQIASIEEVERELQYCDGWFSKEEALRRLRRGHRLFWLRQGERKVCFEWSELEDIHIRWLDLRFSLARDTVYGTGLYTTPDLREEGLASRLAREVSRYWKARGFKHYLVVVDPQNTTSLRMQLRRGFVPYQTVCYRRRLWLRCYSVRRTDSPLRKQWFRAFSSPSEVWKAFWCFSAVLAPAGV